MKKILIISLFTLFAQAQNESYLVRHEIDIIDKTEYFVPSEDLIISNKDKTRGFVITPAFSKEDGIVLMRSLIVKSYVGSDCVEKSKLYIMLENDNIIALSAWNDFNCKNTSYFDFTNEDLELLKNSKIKIIRFVNGSDSAEFDGVNLNKKNFFIRAILNLKITNK